MDGVYFEVTNKAVVVNTRVFPGVEDVYKTEIVMPKEIFLECYNRWIKPQEEGNLESEK